MFNLYKLFVVLAALVAFAVARPSLIGPAIIPGALSHAGLAGPLVVASPSLVAVPPSVIAGPLGPISAIGPLGAPLLGSKLVVHG